MDAPTARVRRLVDDAGAGGTVAEALEAAGRDAVPEDPAALGAFLDDHLMPALVGRLHPATAGRLVEAIREALLGSGESGARRRPSTETATVPPPAEGEAHQAYEDLATGAVHERVTPVWGIPRPGEGGAGGERIWVLISEDPALVAAARRAAPAGVELLVASSMAVLKGALRRAEHPASAVVLDAGAPSIPLERSLDALLEASTKVVLWRMPEPDRARLLDASPEAHGWLPCDAEVTPAEIGQLLGLSGPTVDGDGPKT